MWIEVAQDIHIHGTWAIQGYLLRCKGFISNEFLEIKLDSDDLDPRNSGLIRFQVIQVIHMIQAILVRRTQGIQWGAGDCDSNLADSVEFMDLEPADPGVSGRLREFNSSGFKGFRRVRRGTQGIYGIQTRRAYLIKGVLGV